MEFTGIPKEAFTSCFQDLQKRWQQCIECEGKLLRRGQEALVVKLNFVIFTDSISELYGQRMLNASQITQGNVILFPNWQKESWQTFEETSRYVRPERVNKWLNSMTDV
jgi:hypothetical protein